MHALDWWIVAALVVVLFAAALSTRRYTRSVGAFLVANRCGGRYIISMANAMAGLGVITLVGLFEQNYRVGFTAIWWNTLTEPVLVVMALSGWVLYRFRQTRAMTLAQFFEMRYSRNFRVFTGLVAFVAGLVNFGIFPAVGARFFIALCGLPETFSVAGLGLSTYPTLMVGLLSISITFTFLGGHIAVMVTDFIQGVFANVVFIVVIVFLLVTIDWSHIATALLDTPPEKSLVHPMHVGDETHFNPGFFLIAAVIIFYGVLTWQGAQGYNCCARDAHEAKMVGILYGWRFRVLLLIAIVVPIVVRTVLVHPAYAEQAATVGQTLAAIDASTASATETLRNQMRTPVVLGVILPAGLLGLMCAAMLAALVSTYDTYLHSWGSILVQDVILPFRKRSFTPRQHLWLLRASIFAVAVFIFGFSLLFRQTQYILMFFAITGAVFFGGAGSAIIGGLYWKRGTTAGAWGAMITGMTLSMGGFVFAKKLEEQWGITSQEMTFIAMAMSVAVYVGVSLLGPRKEVDMDRLLNRGAHALADETSVAYGEASTWPERLGLSREFTRGDRFITYVSLGWPVAWTLIFIGGTIYNFFSPVSAETWLRFWQGWTWVVLAASIAVVTWFSIGGAHDMVYLFRNLRRRENALEDGRVPDR